MTHLAWSTYVCIPVLASYLLEKVCGKRNEAAMLAVTRFAGLPFRIKSKESIMQGIKHAREIIHPNIEAQGKCRGKSKYRGNSDTKKDNCPR